jgi:hypothetical protein
VGDTHYYLTSLMLAPHETRAIDLRQLRDAQVADFKKNKIPAGATDGSVNWVRLDNVPVMGRVAVVTNTAGLASSYDCCTCPCALSFMGLVTVSPASFALLPTETEALGGSSKFADCNYYVYWYDTTSWAGWSSSDTSVVTMDTSVIGQANAQGGGTATATAQYNACGYWYYNPLTLTCTCSNNTSGSGGSSANVVTATITVHFTGSKAASDNLTFPSSGTCSQTLGLLNCTSPGDWVWNVEIEADVSDDASKWTPHQSYTGPVTGYYKDSNGNLHSFSYNQNVSNDDPSSQAVQQPAGQKTIFWIDAPGHYYTYNGYQIDSMTDIEDFTSKVCSKVTTTTCASVAWYLKIVVDAGAVLDTTNSKAGFGSL